MLDVCDVMSDILIDDLQPHYDYPGLAWPVDVLIFPQPVNLKMGCILTAWWLSKTRNSINPWRPFLVFLTKCSALFLYLETLSFPNDT